MNKHELSSVKKYNKLATNYNKSFDGRFTAKYKQKLLNLCDETVGGCALDVGCGNGSLINSISQKAQVSAYGVDISPNMIQECRKLYPHIEFDISSAESLKFDNNSLDLVTMNCVLHHLDTPENFIKEANRILKQGGTLIICEPWFPWGLRHITDWIVSPLLKAGDNKIFSHKRFKNIFTEHGFTIIETYKKGLIQIIKARKA